LGLRVCPWKVSHSLTVRNPTSGPLISLGRLVGNAIGPAATLAALALGVALRAGAQTPSNSLLILEKNGSRLDIIDPANLNIVARVPAGTDPHEVIASGDGKLAYVSNYGGPRSSLHMITVVDLVAQKTLPAIDLGALHGAHGLDFAGGELYFTAETNKVIGRYDPATQMIDWVMGTGEDRTHMIWVAKTLDRIVTSNVSSATISIIERVAVPSSGPSSGAEPQTTWEVRNVPVGRGAEGFDISPDGRQIWTANAQDATVSIIGVAGKDVTRTVPISVMGANRLKFTLDGKLALVSGLGTVGRPGSPGPNLVVLDVANHKELKQLNLGGGAAGILMDPSGSRAFVAVSGANKVVVVDLKSLTVTNEIAPVGQPDGMAWAARN
jgi:YVTN family beta-propeller protein